MWHGKNGAILSFEMLANFKGLLQILALSNPFSPSPAASETLASASASASHSLIDLQGQAMTNTRYSTLLGIFSLLVPFSEILLLGQVASNGNWMLTTNQQTI